jgi:hypothetical protein
MLTRAARSRPLATTAMAMLLLAGFAMPAQAGQWLRRQGKLASCGHNKTVVRIDSRTCPGNRHRPAIVLRRACCENPQGNSTCKPFPPCPSKSPS